MPFALSFLGVLLVLVPWTLAPAAPPQATPDAEEILTSSIRFHDPEGLWEQSAFRLEITGTRPLAGPTHTEVVIDNAEGVFHYTRERRGQTIDSTVRGDECDTRLDGRRELTDLEIERFGLSCEAMQRTRDYHVYLYGLPMKLRDAGTRIDPEPTRATFGGRDAWEVRVTYDPEVGADTWYFYFDPDSSELIGYRFYHDEAANDGEYVLLDRLEEGGGLRLPKARSWFTHGDERLLGTDTIREIERLDGGS